MNEQQLQIETLQCEKLRLEEANQILLETVKVAQAQKDLYYDEQLRIQNSLQLEIDKYKVLLVNREEEAFELLKTIREKRDKIERLQEELESYRHFKPKLESLKVMEMKILIYLYL